jgi:hypothetical protein
MDISHSMANIEGMFPYWRTLDHIMGDNGAQAIVDADAIPEPDNVSFTKSVYVPGTFHTIDGVTKDLLNHSIMWKDMKIGLEKMASFFSCSTLPALVHCISLEFSCHPRLGIFAPRWASCARRRASLGRGGEMHKVVLAERGGLKKDLEYPCFEQ